jgi:ssDNA-binding Zn-finger/Zn-ribbon topoisomerase 1
MPSLEVLLDSSRIAIQSHVCPKCSGPMILIRIKPSRIGFDLRTFQGVNCDHVDQVVTETKSMKWISSRLRSPV